MSNKIPSGDFMIEVNRNRHIHRPSTHELLDWELERKGPREYHLRTLRFSRAKNKSGRAVIVHQVYQFAQDQNLLQHCLSRYDGRAIEEKGVKVFQAVFGDEFLLLLKSAFSVPVRKRSYPNIYVPYICVRDDAVVQGEWRIDEVVPDNCVIPFFSSGHEVIKPKWTDVDWEELPGDTGLHVPFFFPHL